MESTEANRNAYRDMLFSTPGMEEFISGVILFDETLRQSTVKDNTPYPVYLTNLGVIPGIKVDKGAKPLAGAPGETITEGLDGLRERLKEYYDLGARFTKWRAVINIGDNRFRGLVTGGEYGVGHTNQRDQMGFSGSCRTVGNGPDDGGSLAVIEELFQHTVTDYIRSSSWGTLVIVLE